jgi:predicted secreted hydrolase
MIGIIGRMGVVLVVATLAASTDFPYRPALPGYHYSFPRDHFEHPDFRTEWWYYTGNLRSAQGKHFGFELVFFRQGRKREPPENRSAWRIDDVYLAHLALTDIEGGKFYPEQRLNRAGGTGPSSQMGLTCSRAFASSITSRKGSTSLFGRILPALDLACSGFR